MEVAPELQFKHYTLAEAQLSADVVVNVEGIGFDDVAICCDLDTHVFNAEHTEPAVARALRASHWFDLREWSSHGPGAAA
jgi:hypothetical protein